MSQINVGTETIGTNEFIVLLARRMWLSTHLQFLANKIHVQLKIRPDAIHTAGVTVAFQQMNALDDHY